MPPTVCCYLRGDRLQSEKLAVSRSTLRNALDYDPDVVELHRDLSEISVLDPIKEIVQNFPHSVKSTVSYIL